MRLFWSGKQATGIFIPAALAEDDKGGLQVYMQNTGIPMLGEYQSVEEGILFQPPVPLSAGGNYEVFFHQKLIGRLRVPLPDARDAPELVALYPSADTLPENLLKIYLQFSSPMREGEALRHVYLLNEQADTLSDIFLDLQPELWNRERTALTIWLDPGRIKRDLIPNQRLGNPLKKGAHYTLVVKNDWKDAQGLALKDAFKKRFSVSGRDDANPQPGEWKLAIPGANTLLPLRLGFNETLDYFLLLETVQVINEKNAVVEGSITVVKEEAGLEFHPAAPWRPGKFRLRVAAYLEDLAGNNLNRPFDRDTWRQEKKEDAFVERVFVVR